MTQVSSGNFTNGNAQVPIERQMYAEFRQLNATASALPLGLARGLDFYLKNFPHGCTEQITSAAFARLVLADEADFGLSRAEVNEQLEKRIRHVAPPAKRPGRIRLLVGGDRTGDRFRFRLCDALPE